MRTVRPFPGSVDRRSLLKHAAGTMAAVGAASVLSRVTPASAQLTDKLADELKNGEFNWFPERSETGPILIIVSVPDQRVHVYRNGVRIAASSCSTGKPGHRTPTGVFTILQKDKHHRSSTYNGAPMPNMNRLTWSGIALHAGQLPGYPASHGCIRLPMGFSERLFQVTRLGMTVVIADDTTQPASVTHPGMILGQYARNEFHAVETAILRSAYAEGHEAKPKTTALVVSRKSGTARVLENGRVVARGPVTIKDPGKPVGNRVYTLAETDADAGRLTWLAASFTGGSDMLAAPQTLERITIDPRLLESARRRMHLGMTLVTTDEADTARRRTAARSGFVVIDGPADDQG